MYTIIINFTVFFYVWSFHSFCRLNFDEVTWARTQNFKMFRLWRVIVDKIFKIELLLDHQANRFISGSMRNGELWCSSMKIFFSFFFFFFMHSLCSRWFSMSLQTHKKRLNQQQKLYYISLIFIRFQENVYELQPQNKKIQYKWVNVNFDFVCVFVYVCWSHFLLFIVHSG